MSIETILTVLVLGIVLFVAVGGLRWLTEILAPYLLFDED